MFAPRLVIDLEKLFHNARTLTLALGKQGISVTGVTKATLGSPEIARVLLQAGVHDLGDSRTENLQRLRAAGVASTMTLIRSPMLSRVNETVRCADRSLNTEPALIAALDAAAQRAGRIHGIVLMVELGDLREGIMPAALPAIAAATRGRRHLRLHGIGTNLACRSGVVPDAGNMGALSALADAIDADSGERMALVSGGNSANLAWALGSADKGRVNNLRLGEAILLGCDPLDRQPIAALHTDAIELVAEVIESGRKPSRPVGRLGQGAFGTAAVRADSGMITQSILALGIQDTDPAGLVPPAGIRISGASSDHLLLESDDGPLAPGTQLAFRLDYSALLRAMSSPHVLQVSTFSSGALRRRSGRTA